MKHIPGVNCLNKDILTNSAPYVTHSYNIEECGNVVLFDTVTFAHY